MISYEGFWRGRDVAYKAELTHEIRANADESIRKVDLLLVRAGFEDRDATSGWRPSAVNSAVAGAARKSKHMKGQAIDVEDADRALSQWCMANLDVLEELGLWMEHPRDTKSWCHLQTVPPGSGKRVFYAK